MAQKVAPHLAPENCYVCGREPHEKGEHVFWSNADADREFNSRPSVSDGGAEARYVQAYRPY